ncbi:MAG: ParB/RepB/Spo0J family partition protein [Candidatus Moraniibacteriota bacterium]
MSEKKIYAEVKMVKTESLKPNEYNPNVMTDEQFKSLIDDFKENGWVGQPVIANEQNVIIDGEHRWRCASFLGYEKVPVIVFNPKDEDHQKMLTIGWNAKRGENSPVKLAGIIQELTQRHTLEELSIKMGFSESHLKDTLAMTQVTKEFMDKIKKDAEMINSEVPAVMNFAVNKEQEKIINEALEISIGKSKGEKLCYICNLYLKQK